MTRQWLANPSLMCIPHRNAEHAEAHMFVKKMLKGYSLKGFIDGSMFFGAEFILARHDLISSLMPHHKTPLVIADKLFERYPLIVPKVEDFHKSISVLLTRCPSCRENHTELI